MKKPLLTTAVTLAVVSSSASAAERVQLPPKMLGTWCLKSDASDKSKTTYERGNWYWKNAGFIAISYEGWENGCTTVKSTRRKDVVLSPYVTEYRCIVQYRCGGEGMTWFESLEMYMDEETGTLVVKNLR